MLVAEIVFSQIDLVQKFIFPRFIELLLYFYHFYVVCYAFYLMRGYQNIVWRKPFVSDKQFHSRYEITLFLCYKVTRKLPFLIFKFELFYTDFFNINKEN